MFNLSPFEIAFVAIWAIGVVFAVALIFTRDLKLRSRLIILGAALLIPVIGSLAVIAYGIYSIATSGRSRIKNQSTSM